ncbi:MAG: hypothetical protein GXX99_05565, partial [Clostridiales bacterium]|nr:hypothetical protein [Clostridiales bacterium]
MRRKLALLSIVACLLTLTGCWDYTELNQEELVIGISLDVGQSKAYLLAVEVVCFDGEEVSGRVHMAEGDNLDECVHGLVRQLGQFPLLPHASVLLFSEEIARQNLMPVLEWIVKDRKIPLGILLTMVERGPAYELMQAGIGKLPRSLTIAEMLHDELTYGKIHAIPLYVFYDEATTLGKTSSVPSIMLRSN